MSGHATEWVIRPAGARGLLVEAADGSAVRWLTAWLRTSEFADVLEDVVPGGRTVLVRAQQRLDELARALRELPAPDHRNSEPSRTVEVPVTYSGEDLDEVCERAGVSRSTFVGEHSSAHHTVAFFGFTPGFPYIAGVPDALQVPRRATPRTRVAAGAVAVANGFTVVYPGGTPGGWSVIGYTSLPPLWDLTRDPPNLVSVGDRVIFRDVS